MKKAAPTQKKCVACVCVNMCVHIPNSERLFCFTCLSIRFWWTNLPLWCVSDLPASSLWYQTPRVYPDLRQSPWMWPSRWVPAPSSTCLRLLTLCHFGCCLTVFSSLQSCCDWHPLLPVLGGCFCEGGSVIWATAGNHSALHLCTLDVTHTRKAGRISCWSYLSGTFLLFLLPTIRMYILRLSIFLQNWKYLVFCCCCFYRSNIYLLYKKKESEIKSVKSEDWN